MLPRLTYRECIADLSRAWKDFERFVRLVHKVAPDWKYVCVAERQKRGAVHFHVAVKGWQDVMLLRSCWWAIVGQGQGNIDVQRSKRGGGAWKLVSLAQYLAKYVTKEISQVERYLGVYRFRASLGIEIPTVKRFAGRFDLREIANLFLEYCGVAMRSMWLSDDMLNGWAASW